MIKKLIAFAIGTFFAFFVASTVFAQSSPEEIARRYGITFPIAELDNCADYSSCRTYCEDPVNYNKCIDFAKKKGFHKEEPLQRNKSAILAAAKAELGCDSETSCMAFCEQPANFEKCSSFAKRHDLGGGHTEDPANARILEIAKRVLGCDSYASCSSYCEQAVNRQKCSRFAQEAGLRGGEYQAGPGGCTSEETCRAFCSDPNNFELCSKFGAPVGGFRGPGGCNSEASCRAYCEANPGECGYYSSGSPPGGITPEEYCKQYPEKCQIPTGGTYPGGTYDPATECAKSPGCSWTGTTCQCAAPSGGYSGGSTYDPATECTKQTGCSWTGTTCECSGSSGSYSPPPSESSPSPTPGVYGLTTTVGGLLQNILQYLFGTY